MVLVAVVLTGIVWLSCIGSSPGLPLAELDNGFAERVQGAHYLEWSSADDPRAERRHRIPWQMSETLLDALESERFRVVVAHDPPPHLGRFMTRGLHSEPTEFLVAEAPASILVERDDGDWNRFEFVTTLSNAQVLGERVHAWATYRAPR